MKEFDYKRVWAEAAFPEVMALPADVHRLFADVCEQAANLRQGPNLDVPMPEPLIERFDALDTETLSRAARAFYFFGHWASGEWSAASSIGRGAYWKFSNFADQALTRRLGMRRERSHHGNGFSKVVLEGALRGCLSTPNSWRWVEVGPATPAVYAELAACGEPEPPPRSHRSTWETWEDNMVAKLEALAAWYMPRFGLLANTSRFMVEVRYDVRVTMKVG